MSRLVDLFAAFGVEMWIFGGWAEELRGLCSPREHGDLDLLYPPPCVSFEPRQLWISEHGVLTTRKMTVMAGVIFHGGGAAKVSASYEDEWSMFCVLDVLAGLANAIQIEQPGAPGVGFEFWLRLPSAREWHQVKAQNSKRGHWSMYDLQKVAVLKNFGAKLAGEPDDHCVFVSAQDAAPFGRLCAHASHAPNLAAMLGTFMPTIELKEAFDDLRDKHWGLGDDEVTWRWLRRCDVRGIDEMLLTRFVDERLRTLIDADPSAARVSLEKVMKATLHNPVNTKDLWDEMEALGCPRRSMSLPAGTVSGAIRDRVVAFVESRRQGLINGSFIPRTQVAEVVGMLGRARPPRSVLLTGDSGCGKSQVLGAIVHELAALGWPILTLDVSGLDNETNAESVGLQLGLPAAPARTLAGTFSDQRAVLVVDALDTASSLRERPITLFGAVGEVIEQARAYPNIVLLVSCRSFELENDDRLRSLAYGREASEQIELAAFTVQDVEGALAAAGVSKTLTTAQYDVLRNGYNLSLFVKLGENAPDAFSSRQDLEAAYADLVLRT